MGRMNTVDDVSTFLGPLEERMPFTRAEKTRLFGFRRIEDDATLNGRDIKVANKGKVTEKQRMLLKHFEPDLEAWTLKAQTEVAANAKATPVETKLAAAAAEAFDAKAARKALPKAIVGMIACAFHI